LKDNGLSLKHPGPFFHNRVSIILSLEKKKKKKTLLCYHDILKAIILPHVEGNRVGRMVGHPITKEEPH
jgi:hypothetical protein